MISFAHKIKPYLLLIFLFLICSLPAAAQLIADFTMNKAGGCSPLIVTFNNTSTGYSENVTWTWNFSNGSTSTLKNPSASFLQEKSYMITLTAKDGTKTATKSATVTVYKRPVIDFTNTPANGCAPFTSTFTGSISSADGKIALWTWDFGDGITEQTTSPVISHIYNWKQTASVGLTVSDEFGCSGTVTKKDVVKIASAGQASFTADKTNFCSPDAKVNFTNNSTGSGTLTYLWDFGDGHTSEEKSPAHTYTRKGTYDVSLTLKSSEGCEIVKKMSGYINVGEIKPDFAIPDARCVKTAVRFINTTTPRPTYSKWYVDGTLVPSSTDSSLVRSFISAGKYSIKLVAGFDDCEVETTKEVTIAGGPKLDTFIVIKPPVCLGPYELQFKDTTAEAVRWRWNFNYSYGDGTMDGLRDMKERYGEGTYTVYLEVDNAAGCSSSISKKIRVEDIKVLVERSDPTREQSCDSLVKTYTVTSSQKIVEYLWDFGDGGTSTAAAPVHTFDKRGEYLQQLKYKTETGCIGIAPAGVTAIRQKPTIDFSVQSTVCGSNYVHFTPVITGDFAFIGWDFGDKSGIAYTGTHRYSAAGTYDVTVVAINGVCNDTVTKKSIITAFGPFPKIHAMEYTCDGDRDVITITDSTTSADLWIWNYDDGTTDTLTARNPKFTHKYPKNSNYLLKLTAIKGDCILSDSVIVFLLKKQKPVLSFTPDEVCVDNPTILKVRNIDESYLHTSSYRYSIEKWENKDGSIFMPGPGFFYGHWYQDLDATFTPKAVYNDSVRLIVRSYFYNCFDTTNFARLVVKGVYTDFSVLNNDVCFKTPIIFNDITTTSAGTSIVSRKWDFGDGQQLSNSGPGIITHTYTNPGIYYVTLTVSDGNACNTSKTNTTTPVKVYGAKASFTVTPGTSIPTFSEIEFINTTNISFAGTVTYSWDFGDGSFSMEQSPRHSFNKQGVYHVRLIAKDITHACSDTAVMDITVSATVPNIVFKVNKTFIGDYGACPPVKASFLYTSNIPYKNLSWDFGDGIILQNQTSPSHTYIAVGTYIIKLSVENVLGIVTSYVDTIHVSKPRASIATKKYEACIGDTVYVFSPAINNKYQYAWDFGNGFISITSDSTAKTMYQTSGTYKPVVIVRDTVGCATAAELTDDITVHPDPLIVITPSSATVCKNDSLQLVASGGETFHWSPSSGLNNDAIANPKAKPVTQTKYMVNAVDVHGCKGKAEAIVDVAYPINLASIVDQDICDGEQVSLQTSGAYTYKWIENVAGLSNTTSNIVIASPLVTSKYTVVGYDNKGCYTDTIAVTVHVRPSPWVSLDKDIELLVGTPTVLSSNASADVKKWEWLPSTYLSCDDCPSPTSTPNGNIQYTLKVENEYNCSAEDTIKIITLCTGGKITIPTAFTPNNDGHNDRFGIPAQGVKKVLFLKIYNRWGQLVFEKNDFKPGDLSGFWNGKYKGEDALPGTYVYFTELECSVGERFQKNGTLLLVR